LTPNVNELVLIWGVVTSVALFARIDQEINATVRVRTNRETDRQTHAQTATN